MTEKEAIIFLEAIKRGLHQTGKDHPYRDDFIPKMKEALDVAIKLLKAELKAKPKNRIERERYEDLVGYFGGDKTILESREEFQKWLARKRCDELAREKEAEPCEDAISRDAVWAKITNGAYSLESLEQFIDRISKEVEAMPSVTPKQKAGKWIVLGRDDPDCLFYRCSECHMKITLKFNYCPNCSAKMEGIE